MVLRDWNFTGVDTKYDSHCFHSYPAMLVPQIASELINEYGKKATLLFDPFCGTGTTLVEANLKGINSIGTDLNPLARLIASAKTTPIGTQSLDLVIKDFYDYLFNFRFGFTKKDSVIAPKFSSINFWFSKNVIMDLAVIKDYIEKIEDDNIQNFFKVAFSQTIRDCSWTRKNEFKLYKMDAEKLKTFKPDVFSVFETVLSRNRVGLISFANKNKSHATTTIHDFNTVNGIPKQLIAPRSVNLVVTSPPYGDSQTTVAYGQFSRLTNEWLDNSNSQSLDAILMGGKKYPEILKFSSQSLNRSLKEINALDMGRCKDVVSFYHDYQRSIANLAKVVKRRGYACYIVSNRCVKGVTLKTDLITKNFFEQVGFDHVETIKRKISNKRMPRKNSPAGVAGETKTLMNTEYIVVMRKR